MDVYCQHCGEPCDTYHLYHDMESEFREMFKAGTGCDCCEGKGEPVNTARTQAMGVLAEMLGDDIDGIASTLDDFEFIGLLED